MSTITNFALHDQPSTHPVRELDVNWARVDVGFYVGSRNGAFVGYIEERRDGRFVAYDGQSLLLGDFDNLAAATSALAAQ